MYMAVTYFFTSIQQRVCLFSICNHCISLRSHGDSYMKKKIDICMLRLFLTAHLMENVQSLLKWEKKKNLKEKASYILILCWFKILFSSYNLNNYSNHQASPSFQCLMSLKLSNFQFLQSYHKLSKIKVALYMLRVKDMHSGSPSDLQGSMRQGKAEIHALQYFARRSQSAFIKTLISVSSPPQYLS